ncbi:hypothetical protein ACWDV4_02140 [Micromonospora sp. NPDC003197]
MVRRTVVVLPGPIGWAPAGTDPTTWRAALAEDVVDLIATLNGVDPAIAVVAADRPLADVVAWPGMPIYDVPTRTVNAVAAATAADGYDQVAVLAADAPDVPGLILGKLLRPLSSRTVAVAPNSGGGGLLGVAVRLPAPDWLPEIDLDTADLTGLRSAATRPGEVAATPGWRRLGGPADLPTLDPAIEGWELTRALLAR